MLELLNRYRLSVTHLYYENALCLMTESKQKRYYLNINSIIINMKLLYLFIIKQHIVQLLFFCHFRFILL